MFLRREWDLTGLGSCPVVVFRNDEKHPPSHTTGVLLFFIILSGVRECPLGTAATIGVLYQPRIGDDCECGAVL